MPTSLCRLVSIVLAGMPCTVCLPGPLFDDYLNPVRPGPGTGPGPVSVLAAPGSPVGQSFTLPGKTTEIYRIGVRPVYETWAPGEQVTLTLWDSPRRQQRLAQYAIDHATSAVLPVHETKDRVLYFQLRYVTKARSTFYFELTTTGDGVAFQAFNEDKLTAAQAFPANGQAKDLAFACHVKKTADGTQNLRQFFTERLDLARPELAGVKELVDRGDFRGAIAAAAKHFHERIDVWGAWSEMMEVKPRLDADTELADLLMKNRRRHVETKQALPWRAESYWVATYPVERARPEHSAEPSVYLWHLDRILGQAWVETGKKDYARKAINLRMQFILDNPNPKLTGVPWYFELWNDRTAAGRAPGHGTLGYARLYHYPDWADDERLVFFSFLEDNARWVYKAESGANWGAEAARACYEFGVSFPEWKMSPQYVAWGTQRLAEIVMQSVRGDGTSTEAAIKYHAMVARRLKGMLEDHVQGRIKLEDALFTRLKTVVEQMYEHMAYTLQPNNVVVMGGDSWNENYAFPAEISRKHVIDPGRLARALSEAKDLLSRFLKGELDTATRAQVDRHEGDAAPSDELVQAILAQLNRLMSPPKEIPTGPAAVSFYEPERFAHVELTPSTARLAAQVPLSVPPEHLNRLLISEAYPQAIAPPWRSGELASAGELVGRPDFLWFASQGREGSPPREISKVFPDGGYFIMRAGGTGAGDGAYVDARQMFIHNGPWFGSHGHFDLLSVNLYAWGRTLIIDPGQYAYTPPPGIDNYWSSQIHSTLVLDGRDMARAPGASEWSVSHVADVFEGRHHGYRNTTVRRRIAFIKPDYFLVDDAIDTPRDGAWAQVWNMADPEARVDAETGTIETTFPAGGNVLLLSAEPQRFTVEQAPGIICGSDRNPATRIVRLIQKTDQPRFQTLIYPYDSARGKPEVVWRTLPPDQADAGNLVYAAELAKPTTDWCAFGRGGTRFTFDGDKHAIDADFAFVRSSDQREPRAFAWMFGRSLKWNGLPLATAEAPVHTLGVMYDGSTAHVEAREAETSLAIAVQTATSFTLNGERVAEPVIREGMFYPFASSPPAIVADDRDAFVRVTKTDEWQRTPDPGSWNTGYTQHETDPGRHEAGHFELDVPRDGRYFVEVFLPRVGVPPSDRVEYRIPGPGAPAPISGPVKAARPDKGTSVVTLDQQAMSGWVRLGAFDLKGGRVTIGIRNATTTDALYLIADAVRILDAPER